MVKAAISKFSLQAQWWLVVINLIFSTVAFGGVGSQAIYVTRLLILASFLFELVLFSIEDDYLKYFHPVIYLPTFFFIAFLILAYLQYFFGLKILNGSIIGSVNPYLTYDSLIQLVVYLMFFIVCLKITSNRQLTERLISLIIVLTFAITILGLAQRLIPNDRILWKSISTLKQSSFGPFTYENHFGGFLALTFPLALGMMHYRFDRVKREFAQKGIKNVWLSLINEGVLFLFFLVILTLVACFFSAARVSLFVLLFCCSAYFIVYAIKERNLRFYLILLLILVSSFLWVQWLSKGNFAGNFGLKHLEESWNIRFEVARQSLGLLHEYPLFGTGLETYGQIFAKAVKHLINEVRWVHHNDYIELLTDTGIAGFGLFIGSVSILLFSSLWQMRKNLSPWNKSIATQAVISIFCMGAMELSDFHLKVPSIALLFTLQLALLFQSSHSKKKENEQISHQLLSHFQVKAMKGIVLAILSILCVPIITFSTHNYQAWKLTNTKNKNRLTNLQRAIKFQPSNSELWFLLGMEYETSADEPSKKENALMLKREGITALRKAVNLSPTYGTYWYRLGVLEYAVGYDKEGLSSLEKAVYWSPVLLKYSVYLLAAYLRESEKIRPSDEQIEFSKRARILYDRLQTLEVKPGEGHYGAWMGEYYHRKLQQLIPVWNMGENRHRQ